MFNVPMELALVLGGWLGGCILFAAGIYGLMRFALWRETRRRQKAAARVHHPWGPPPAGHRRLP